MDHLNEISVEELQDTLDNVEGKKPTQRIVAAIAYKNGITQTELAEWYGVQRRTIHSWLKRLDGDESLAEAVSDNKRTGRKRKLTETQQQGFEAAVHDSPKKVGFEAAAWTPELAQNYLKETYNVKYLIPSCRRLLKEAGLRYHKPTSSVAKADKDEQEAFHGEHKQSAGRWMPL